MSFSKIAILLSTIGIFAITSCHKNNNSNVGGKGGTATLLVYPQHHTLARNIDTCAVYIKYNQQELPAVGTPYDDTVVCIKQDTLVKAIFTNLKNGNYYLYGYGYDTSFHQPVRGGISCTINTQGDTTIVYLPVSE